MSEPVLPSMSPRKLQDRLSDLLSAVFERVWVEKVHFDLCVLFLTEIQRYGLYNYLLVKLGPHYNTVT